jgi:hypothetical protein
MKREIFFGRRVRAARKNKKNLRQEHITAKQVDHAMRRFKTFVSQSRTKPIYIDFGYCSGSEWHLKQCVDFAKMIEESGANTIGRIFGRADSAAALIFLACRRREAKRRLNGSAIIRLHAPTHHILLSHPLLDDKSAVKAMAEELLKQAMSGDMLEVIRYVRSILTRRTDLREKADHILVENQEISFDYGSAKKLRMIEGPIDDTS